jgi:hypothetical protein
MVNEKSHPDILALKNAPFALFIVTRSYTAAAKNWYVLVTVLEIFFNRLHQTLMHGGRASIQPDEIPT